MTAAIRVLIPAILLAFAGGDVVAKTKAAPKKAKPLNPKLLVGTWTGKLVIAETGKPKKLHDMSIKFAKGKAMEAKLFGQAMKATYSVKGRTIFFVLNGVKMKLAGVTLRKNSLKGTVRPVKKDGPLPKNMKISVRLKRAKAAKK